MTADTHSINTSGIQPTEFNVLVVVDEVPEKTKGGIILPDERRDREQAVAMKGTLIAASPLAFGYDTWPESTQKPVAGQRVAVAKHAGVEIEGSDEVRYRLVKDKDIMAVLDGL